MVPSFYLGTHKPCWLGRTDVPLFLSAVTLRAQRTIPKAKGPVGVDSGGFSVLSQHGYWTGDDPTYAEEVDGWERQADRKFDFAACRDWMCEPIIRAKTGKTIEEHQALTIESYAALKALKPRIRWLPVLQGYELADYLAHIAMYERAGFDLRAEQRVGVGSICRRQATREGAGIVLGIARQGIRVHAFGVKSDGLKLMGREIASADSMAWSSVARIRRVLLDRCARTTKHKTCSNCMRWALEWKRTRIDGHAPVEPLTMKAPGGRGSAMVISPAPQTAFRFD